MPVVDLPDELTGSVCGDWIAEDDLTCSLPDTVTSTHKELAISAASWVLWKLSGSRYGTCEVTIRPCRARCDDVAGRSLPFVDSTSGWVGVLFGCGCSKPSCSCTAPERVALPNPTREILSVTVDGVVLDPSAYRLVGRRWLHRLDGESWPACQDMDLGLDEEGTFGIQLVRGRPVPSMGLIAVAELACELAKSFAGEGCNLPARVTTVTRQGMTFAMLDPMTFLDHGRTGLYNVDLFLATANPSGLRRRSTVHDARRMAR